MPKLKKVELKKIELPSFADDEDKAWVEIMTPAKMEDFEAVEQGLSPTRQFAQVIASKIKDWNFYDDNNEKLPVTMENVLLLSPVDYGCLVVELELDKVAKLNSVKKNN